LFSNLNVAAGPGFTSFNGSCSDFNPDGVQENEMLNFHIPNELYAGFEL
jgi:hypothetical protein